MSAFIQYSICHTEEVNKADLARGLLQTICQNAIKIGILLAVKENCRDVVLTGSFVTSHITQVILTQEFEKMRGEMYESSTAECSVSIISHTDHQQYNCD